MHLPQMIYGALMVAGLAISMALHGKPRTGEHNFFASLIATGICVWILHAGGFW